MAEIERQISHVNGVAVLAVERAVAPHPHPSQGGKLVPYRGVLKALLEDGTEVYLCEGTDGGPSCDYHADSVRQITTHRASIHPKRPRAKSLYPEATLRRVLTESTRARAQGIRGWRQRTVAAMNQTNVKPLDGGEWTGGMISSIWHSHGSRIKIRVPREAKLQTTHQQVAQGQAAAEPVLNGQVTVLEQDDLAIVRTFVTIAPALAQALARLADYVEAGAVADPAITDKARRWDEMQALLGGHVVG